MGPLFSTHTFLTCFLWPLVSGRRVTWSSRTPGPCLCLFLPWGLEYGRRGSLCWPWSPVVSSDAEVLDHGRSVRAGSHVAPGLGGTVGVLSGCARSVSAQVGEGMALRNSGRGGARCADSRVRLLPPGARG